MRIYYENGDYVKIYNYKGKTRSKIFNKQGKELIAITNEIGKVTGFKVKTATPEA